MKKITIEEARKILEDGKTIKVKISSREIIPVKTKDKLENLRQLAEQGVQECEMFSIENKEIPEDAIEVSMDEAVKLLVEGEIVYGQSVDEDSEDEEITTQNALKQYYRHALSNGNPVLYWK